MEFENFNEIRIPRPSLQTELEIRYLSEVNLRSKFSAGEYTKKEDINSILKFQFQFYSDLLSNFLDQIASRDLLEFLLYQFDLASEIEQSYKDGLLNRDEIEKWIDIGAILRRAIKYLSERVVLLNRQEFDKSRIDKNILFTLTEKALICSEGMAMLYQLSDISFSAFPEYSKLTILPPGEADYFVFKVLKDGISIGEQMQQRVAHDRSNRQRFVSDADNVFHLEVQNRIIGEAFKKTLGISYGEAVGIIAELISVSEPAPQGIPILFIHRGRSINLISQVSGIDKKIIRKTIEGFSISKRHMELEGREIWKPRQEYRAFRRGFFEFPHPTGLHLIFSKKMAIEALAMLSKGVVFRELPFEWKNEATDEALSKLSNRAGQWFEEVVKNNLDNLGFLGVKSIKRITDTQGNKITVPADVGEIDYIGFSKRERLLIIIECKLVSDSPEPKFIRNDISEFITSKKSYLNKFRRKFTWVQTNCQSVFPALFPNQAEVSEYPNRIAGIIVTFFPTMASYLIDDYPCVSLTEFMLDYESISEYPYQVGLHSLEI